MNPKLKVMIPNILTLSRVVFTPIIIILGLTKNFKAALIFVIIASITDLFDGKLARKWNTTTNYGARLDALCDKIFAIGLIACLLSKFKVFIPLLILECIIGLFNLFVYSKTKKAESIMIGKIKTTVLFITVSLGFAALLLKIPNFLINGFVMLTLNIQFLTLISYIVKFYDNYKNKQIEESILKDREETRTKIFDVEEKKEAKEFSSDTKVLNHIKDIFLDED